MKSVLVVEDELLVALVYKQYLFKEGYDIVGPYIEAEEVLEDIEKLSFSVAILDIQLDGEISGLELANIIREKGDQPIIITTGDDLEKTKEKIAHLSNTYFLPKPVDTNELMQIILSI